MINRSMISYFCWRYILKQEQIPFTSPQLGWPCPDQSLFPCLLKIVTHQTSTFIPLRNVTTKLWNISFIYTWEKVMHHSIFIYSKMSLQIFIQYEHVTNVFCQKIYGDTLTYLIWKYTTQFFIGISDYVYICYREYV